MKFVYNHYQQIDPTTTVMNIEGSTLFIYDMIGPYKRSEDDPTVTASDFINQLRNMSGDILVRINSKGGEVSSALTIYQQLREHKGKVTCVIDGYAYSCAAWIALAGEERFINTGGVMMIHNPSMYAEVNGENSIENVMPQWRAHRDAINMIISERTGMTSEKVTELMNATTFLTSKDAVEMGFCNAVRSSSANLPTAIRNSVPEAIKNQLPEPVDCSDLAAKTLMLRSKILVN